MATKTNLQIVDLPNEILTSILSHFKTTSLLKLSKISHHFYHLVRDITYQRLLEAGNHKDYKIIFECYHPATKFTSPYLFCEHLSTNNISSSNLQPISNSDGHLDLEFTDLYSTFLPLKPVVDQGLPRSHPAGGPAPLPPVSNARVDRHEDFICQNINLDSYEQFSQLCTSVNLIRLGPKRGLFKSSYKVLEGTTRIFRRWLVAQAQSDSADILWSDVRNTMGLKVRTLERSDMAVALPNARSRYDEDPAVGYTLVFEAILVRTTKLLLMLEQSMEDEGKSSGKAIVIGSIRDT